jgi:hypothetical protein
MYSAIITRYHGATNTLPSRISVSAAGYKRRYYPWNYELGIAANHLEAARMYASANWITLPELNGGFTATGYVFTALPGAE